MWIILHFASPKCSVASHSAPPPMLMLMLPLIISFFLSTGLGGAAGYILNSINWEHTWLGIIGDQAQIMFVFCLVVAIICFVLTLTSVKETPLQPKRSKNNNKGADEEQKPLLEESNSRTRPVLVPVYKPTTGPDRAYSYDALIRHSPRLTHIRNATSVENLDGEGHHVFSSPQRVRGHSSHSTGSNDMYSDIAISEQDLAVSMK